MPEDKNPSSEPDFDFMLKQQAAQKSSMLTTLGKPMKILFVAVLVLIVVTFGAMLFNRGAGNGDDVVDLMAQSQEIVRVSQLEEQSFKDADTKDLAATTTITMQSSQNQLGSYLKKSGIKYSEKDLAANTNKNADAQLQTAAQNNNLDSAYSAYLKSSLSKYKASLENVYKTAPPQSLKAILEETYISINNLLEAPQFKV